MPRGLRQPAESEAEAAQLRTEAKGLTGEPAQCASKLHRAYELETSAHEARLRLELAAVDVAAFKRLRPELEKRRAELAGQVVVLERELAHESVPLQSLEAEIARVEALASAAEAEAVKLEDVLLGRSEDTPPRSLDAGEQAS